MMAGTAWVCMATGVVLGQAMPDARLQVTLRVVAADPAQVEVRFRNPTSSPVRLEGAVPLYLERASGGRNILYPTSVFASVDVVTGRPRDERRELPGQTILAPGEAWVTKVSLKDLRWRDRLRPDKPAEDFWQMVGVGEHKLYPSSKASDPRQDSAVVRVVK